MFDNGRWTSSGQGFVRKQEEGKEKEKCSLCCVFNRCYILLF